MGGQRRYKKSTVKPKKSKHLISDPLGKQLEQLGLSLKEIAGDGNCLFRALSHQLSLHSMEINHSQLRLDIVNFISKTDDFKSFVTEDFDRYLENMRQNGTFGGNLELVACSKLLNVTISIHQVGQKVWKIESDGGKELNIVYHDHEHYSSTREISVEENTPVEKKAVKQPRPKSKQRKNARKPKKVEPALEELEVELNHLSI